MGGGEERELRKKRKNHPMKRSGEKTERGKLKAEVPLPSYMRYTTYNNSPFCHALHISLASCHFLHPLLHH
jgi:hypothetical protein